MCSPCDFNCTKIIMPVKFICNLQVLALLLPSSINRNIPLLILFIYFKPCVWTLYIIIPRHLCPICINILLKHFPQFCIMMLYYYTHKFVAINIKLRKSVNIDDLLYCMYDIPKPFIARNNILSDPSQQNVLFLSHFDFRFRIQLL